jgi:hypothetical protein
MEWQTGYAALGVSKTNIPVVDVYIQNQKEHHRALSVKSHPKLQMGVGVTSGDKALIGGDL